MNIRIAVIVTIFSLAFSASSTLLANPSATASPSVTPATTVTAPPAAPDNQVSSADADKTPAGKDKPNDDDINRFTNTIVLIKDFYVQSVGDKALLDDAIRVMVSG